MENVNFEEIVNLVAAIAPILNTLIRNWSRTKRRRKRRGGVR